MIVDKAAIASLYPDQATPLSSWINPQSPAYNTDIPLWERDVEKGKQMLDAAGFDYDTPIRITYYYDDQITKDVMDIITQNFADAGVTVEAFLAADGGSYEELYQKRLMRSVTLQLRECRSYFRLPGTASGQHEYRDRWRGQ